MVDPDPERGDSIHNQRVSSEHEAAAPTTSPPVSFFSSISIADSEEALKWRWKQLFGRIKGLFSRTAYVLRPPSISARRPREVTEGQDKLRATIQKNYRQTVLLRDADDTITVNLASLHRIRLLYLQQQLVRQAFDYHYRTVDSDDLEDPTAKEDYVNPGSALHEYTEALRDWEFMKECAQRGTDKDPYILSSRRLPDFFLIRDGLEWFEKEYGLEAARSRNERDRGRAGSRAENRGSTYDLPRDDGNEDSANEDGTHEDSTKQDGANEGGINEDGANKDGGSDDDREKKGGVDGRAADVASANDANDTNDGRSPSGGSNRRVNAPGTISTDYNFTELTTNLSWQNAEPVGGTRGGENRKITQNMQLQRIFMAVIGGFFLIGPMLLMVLVNTRNASLITSSVCVLAFGLVMGVFFLDRPFDVLSGTAAYAAVLVVFVGTSLES